MAQSPQEKVTAAEAFAVGALQAASAASAAGALSQFDLLTQLVGEVWVLLFITCMLISRTLAVFSAVARHHYPMWDMKTRVSLAKKNLEEAEERHEYSDEYLKAFRRAMESALGFLVFGYDGLLGALWYRLFSSE